MTITQPGGRGTDLELPSRLVRHRRTRRPECAWSRTGNVDTETEPARDRRPMSFTEIHLAHVGVDDFRRNSRGGTLGRGSPESTGAPLAQVVLNPPLQRLAKPAPAMTTEGRLVMARPTRCRGRFECICSTHGCATRNRHQFGLHSIRPMPPHTLRTMTNLHIESVRTPFDDPGVASAAIGALTRADAMGLLSRPVIGVRRWFDRPRGRLDGLTPGQVLGHE